MKFLTLFLVFSASAFGQNLHVTAVRDLQPNDPPPVSRAFRVLVVTGDVDGRHYQLQQMKSWGTHLVQVGQDYPVVKVEDRALTVTVGQDRKGRPQTERLDVTGASE